MPNGPTHKSAGLVGGAVTYFIVKDSLKENNLDIGELLFYISTGVGTSRLPDILEPAAHPNHRDFFHSLAFGFLTGYIGTQAWKDFKDKRKNRKLLEEESISLIEIVDLMLVVGSVSYIIHLLLDGFTPKGLRIV